jgi:hypothetical protein
MRKTTRQYCRLKLDATTVKVLSTQEMGNVAGGVPTAKSAGEAICNPKSMLSPITCIPEPG